MKVIFKFIPLIAVLSLAACGGGGSSSGGGGGEDATDCIEAEVINLQFDVQITNSCPYTVNVRSLSSTQTFPVIGVPANSTVFHNRNDAGGVFFGACRAPSVPQPEQGSSISFNCS